MDEQKERERRKRRERGIFEKVPSSGPWWVRYADADGEIHREKIGPKGLAKKVYEKRKTEIRENRFFPPQARRPDLALSLAIDDYLGRKENVLRHFRHYRRLGRYWTAAYGSRGLASIQPAEIEAYAARRLKQVSPATVNRELAFLKRIYYDAMANGKAASNPVRAVKLFRENNARVRFLIDSEEQRLRSQISAEHWQFVTIAMNTGLRQAEQFNLKWENVDFANGIITIPRAKHGEVRHVPINDEVRSILGKLPSRLKNDYVFPNRKGKPMSANTFINRHFAPALGKAKMACPPKTPPN